MKEDIEKEYAIGIDVNGIEHKFKMKCGRYIICRNKYLNILDLSNCPNVENLYCENNHLTNLDISKNLNLKSLDCHENNLSELDVSKNLNLKQLGCCNNPLTNLDISKNLNIIYLDCDNIIDIKNITHIKVVYINLFY